MSFSGEGYSTLEEHLEAQASPILERSQLNFDSLETPPPYIDAPEDYLSSDTELDDHSTSSQPQQAHKDQPQPSLCNSVSITALGPTYPPEITARAGIEPLVDAPEIDSPAGPSTAAYAHTQMIGIEPTSDLSVPVILDQTLQVLPAPREASQALHDALDQKYRSMSIRSNGEDAQIHYRLERKSPVEIVARQHGVGIDHIRKASIESIIEIREVSPSNDNTFPNDRSRHAENSSRPSLPHLDINVSNASTDDPTMKSPALSRHAITPRESQPYQTLAKIHSSHSPESSLVPSPDTRQTLPSLQTALNSATDSNGTPYLGPSPSLAGSARPQVVSPFGASPATYGHPSPNASMSPPRLAANPSFWRTNSGNSSNSTPPDQGSANVSSTNLSANASTPASSVPGLSPSNSFQISGHPGSELSPPPDVDQHFGVMYADMAQQAGMSLQGFRCTWPGCTASPFQTQYLLNSHTNVHSNTRPHFCPVQGCPRGPGGQGFKRKNEMIRHGLVHQSPGYVCPFCPDQQHKYPRPDNLQRHVRVHHVDRDRDDPLLREVLAQRPEGGNRGRRRRIGT